MNIESILPKEGVIPPRPATLRQPEGLDAMQNDNAVIVLLENGKSVVYGGLSLVGENGHFVYMVGILQVTDTQLKGWVLAIGHPNQEKPDFNRIDTTVAPLTEFPFPNTMVYFVGEADETLVAADASSEELQAVARFVLPFINDAGPPRGIDW